MRAFLSAPQLSTRPSIVALLVVCSATACRSATESNSAECPSRIDYLALSGCALISARLVGAHDQPLFGPYRLKTRSPYESFVVTPDGDGHAQWRIVRGANPGVVADTGSVWVIGLQYSTGVGVPPAYVDSALVLLTYAPPGQIPAVGNVTVRLAVP